MTLTQMQYYQLVCRHMNITRAAGELHISQPALSAAIKELEQECGVPLFHRRANALQLTDEGVALLSEIQPILRQYDHIEFVIRNKKLDRNYLRVGFATFSASRIYPTLCRRFRALCPQVQLLGTEGSTQQLYELLDSGRVDLILSGPNPRLSADEWANTDVYAYHPLADHTPMMFCVSKDHPLAGAGSVTWEQIVAEPLILMNDTYSLTRNIRAGIEKAGLRLPDTVQYTSQMFTLERFVEENAACSFLPLDVARSNPLIIPLSYPREAPRPTCVVWKKDQFLFSSARTFLRLAKELFPLPSAE